MGRHVLLQHVRRHSLSLLLRPPLELIKLARKLLISSMAVDCELKSGREPVSSQLVMICGVRRVCRSPEFSPSETALQVVLDHSREVEERALSKVNWSDSFKNN